MSVVRPFPQRQPEAAAGPCNPDAEAAFLGAALIDGAMLDELAALPVPEDFAEPVNGRIWGRILECRAQGNAATGATLRPYFEGEELNYLARLSADGQGLLAPRELAEQIRSLGARRRRIEWHTREAEAARDLDQPLADIAPPEAIRTPAAPLVGLDLAALALREPEAKLFTLPRIAPEGEVSLGEIAVDQPLWKRDNRVWKRGIKAAEKRTNPPALTPRTDPHRPLPESGGNPCTGLHAPTPLYTTYMDGGAEGGPPPSVVDEEGGAHV